AIDRLEALGDVPRLDDRVQRIGPEVRVPVRVDVAHGAREDRRLLEDGRAGRRVDVPRGADADLAVAGPVDHVLAPQLELEADLDVEVRRVRLDHERR